MRHSPTARCLAALATASSLALGVGGASFAAPSTSAPAPAQTNPAQTNPAKVGLAQTSPAQTSPAQTSPAQTSPTQTSPAQAVARSAPAPVGPGNTGVADTRPSSYQPPPAAADRLAAKARMAENIQFDRPLMQGVTGGLTTTGRRAAAGTVLGGGPLTASARAAVPNSAKHSYYLTAGHYYQEKSYTCGPSATRNLIRAMTGYDETETRLAALMGTDPYVGTYIHRIADTLNTRYYNHDYFSLNTPTSPDGLLASTKNIVGNAGHGMVANVQAGYLWYWQGQWATHYNLIYGWNGQNVYVFEEYNPARLGIPGINPSGYWQVSSTSMYNAIRRSPTGQFVG